MNFLGVKKVVAYLQAHPEDYVIRGTEHRIIGSMAKLMLALPSEYVGLPTIWITLTSKGVSNREDFSVLWRIGRPDYVWKEFSADVYAMYALNSVLNRVALRLGDYETPRLFDEDEATLKNVISQVLTDMAEHLKEERPSCSYEWNLPEVTEDDVQKVIAERLGN